MKIRRGSLPARLTTRSDLWLSVGIGFITVLLFLRTAGFQFVVFDDPIHVHVNPRILAQNLAGFLAIWKSPYFNFYIPVTYSAWFAIAHLSKNPDPFLFHLANTCLHAANTVLVFKLITLLLTVRPTETGNAPKERVAALGALFFSLHPIQVEPVAWVSGLRDLLSTFFGLITLILFIRAISAARVHLGKYTGASVCFLLAVLSKPSMTVLPFAACVVAQPYRALDRTQPSSPLRAFWWIAPWGICSVLVALETMRLQSDLTHAFVPFLLRVVVALDALGFYFWKLVFPLHLCVNYDNSLARVREIVPDLPYIMLGLAVSAGLFEAGRRRPEYTWPILLILIGLAPTLGIVPFQFQKYSIAADRYLYFPMIGVAWAVAVFLSRHFSHRVKWMIGCVFLIYLVQTSLQLETWANSRALFEHIIAAGGDPAAAQMKLAIAFRQEGNTAESIVHARRAVELRPNDPEAVAMLGAAFLKDEKYHEAEMAFRRSLDLDSTEIDARWGLGKSLMALGKQPEGEQELLLALKRKPDYLPALYALEDYYKKSNQLANAEKYAKLIAEVEPHFR